MRYIVGSAVEIFSEIDSNDVEGSVITLVSITDPTGALITLNTSMPFGTGDSANIGSCAWQSSDNSPLGQYKYLTKVVNGIYTNYEKAYFFLEGK